MGVGGMKEKSKYRKRMKNKFAKKKRPFYLTLNFFND